MKPIELDAYRKIVVLTGAGISVASGLPTYRGEGGLWRDDELPRYAHASAWRSEPLAVWNAFAPMRAALAKARPNAAHLALAELERRLAPGVELWLITQNVDGLHQAAGSQRVIEMHGNLRRTRCVDEGCASLPFDDERTSFDELPRCSHCGTIQRPDIVLFGEWIGADAEHGAKRALRDCELFIAVGTSGLVSPAASFVNSAKYEGARTLMVNLEPMDPPNRNFDEELLGRAEELLPRLLGVVG